MSHSPTRGSPEFPNQIWGKSVQGFLSYDRTNKQTDKQRLQLYKYRYNIFGKTLSSRGGLLFYWTDPISTNIRKHKKIKSCLNIILGFIANPYLFGNSMTPGKQRLFYPSVEYGQTLNEVGTWTFFVIIDLSLNVFITDLS